MNDAQKIKDKADIIEVIGDFVALKKKGENYGGLCPFHQEKTASFVVSPEKEIYKCFGCGESGDVIKFIQEHEGFTFQEALQYLAKKYNIELTQSKNEKPSNRSAVLTANQKALDLFRNQFQENIKYMHDRGFDDAVCADFFIGYSVNSWDELLKRLTSYGYSPAFLHEAGLLSRSEKGKYYDKFRDRVIFPVISISGQIVGFSGRITLSNSNAPKYLNTPETEAFEKGKQLYGLYQAKKTIKHENLAYVVEGNTDVLRFHQRDVKNTVAPLGTAFTEQQAKLLLRFAENICFVFDGDDAGKKAAVKSIPLALKAGLKVQVISLPKEHDPDSLAREMHESELKAYLENESVIWPDLFIPKGEPTPEEKTNALNHVQECLNSIQNEAERENYINHVARQMGYNESIIRTGVTELTPDSEIWPLDQVKDEIKRANEARMYTDKSIAMTAITSGQSVAVAIQNPGKASLNELKKYTNKIYFQEELTELNLKTVRTVAESGFEVKVEDYMETETTVGHQFVSFTDYYIRYLHQQTPPGHFDAKKENLEELARHLSFFDETTISFSIGAIAKKFGITKTEFKSIIKPKLEQKKSKTTFLNEGVEIDGEQYVFDIENLPNYVDQKAFNKYHFFPAQNKSGRKIFYVFRNPEGSSLNKVGNFYIEPLFHLYSAESQKNKRIIQLNNADGKTVKFMEIPSKDMVSLQAFRGAIFEIGGFVATGMKPFHYDQIMDSIAMRFPITYELETFGQQDEDFWAFSNAILTPKGEIKEMNDLGLVQYQDKTFYSPSVSKIYADVRNSENMFEQDHYFKLKQPEKPASFEEWAALMKDVYKYNDVGYWAIIMTIMSAFRSDIFKIDRLFTSLFFIGATESGKSQIAQSIRAMFIHPDAPMFNLNSGTDAAFFTMLERYRDVPVIMEEYNDMQITDTKFQGIKAAVYDGEGKTKRKAADTKDLDVSKVNSVPILLGQESPERDDASLANRVILLTIKKKDDWTEHEKNIFMQLKEMEKNGLSNILIEILKQRQTVRHYYKKRLRIIQKNMTKKLHQEGKGFQTRILNTVSLFLAMVDVWEQYVPNLKLPFSYEEFYPVAEQKLLEQSESIASTNRLSVFFATLLNLSMREHNGIKHGKEFIIETVDDLKLRVGRDKYADHQFDKPTKCIFLRLNQIHPLYAKETGQEHLKMNNLTSYLKDHTSYIGNVKSWKFTWEEEVREEKNDFATSVIKTRSQYSSAVVLNYETLGIDFGDYWHTKPEQSEEDDIKNGEPIQTAMYTNTKAVF